jgi:S1-C subfamily serine protease
MKRIIIGILAFILLSSTAYASSQWGSYKGNPILQLTSNGQPLKVTDVPAMNFMDRTVVPVYLLQQIGLKVSYDAETKTVDVTLPEQKPKGLTLAELNKIGESVGIVYAIDASGKYVSQGSGFLVGDGVFVTNDHVGSAGDELRIEINGKVHYVKGNTLFRNEKYDLYGVKIDAPGGVRLNDSLPKDNEHVYTIGFPHGRFMLAEGEMMLVYENGFTHSAPTDPGSSGGILLNDRGEVIGITDSGAEKMELNGAIPVKYLEDELKKLN